MPTYETKEPDWDKLRKEIGQDKFNSIKNIFNQAGFGNNLPPSPREKSLNGHIRQAWEQGETPRNPREWLVFIDEAITALEFMKGNYIRTGINETKELLLKVDDIKDAIEEKRKAALKDIDKRATQKLDFFNLSHAMKRWDDAIVQFNIRKKKAVKQCYWFTAFLVLIYVGIYFAICRLPGYSSEINMKNIIFFVIPSLLIFAGFRTALQSYRHYEVLADDAETRIAMIHTFNEFTDGSNRHVDEEIIIELVRALFRPPPLGSKETAFMTPHETILQTLIKKS